MMNRLLIIALLCVFVAPSAFAAPGASKELKFATLAPARSPQGKALKSWAKAVEKKSKGKLTVRWYFGTQGDEQAIVAKMRSGQLDGAAITSVGLSKIHPNILVLEMPGLFENWGQLDRVRDAMKDEFSRGVQGEGFSILGWGDVGLAHVMSKGKAIRGPDDLKSMKVFAWDQDRMAATTSRVLGYTPVLKSIPGLLPALQSGAVNVFAASARSAKTMQWADEVDHIHDMVTGVAIGALVVSEGSLSGLPGNVRTMLVKTAAEATKGLSRRNRKADEKAYKALSTRMTVVELSASEKQVWRQKFAAIRRELAGRGTFPAALISEVESRAGVK